MHVLNILQKLKLNRNSCACVCKGNIKSLAQGLQWKLYQP